MGSCSVENTTKPLSRTIYWMDDLLIDHDIGLGDDGSSGSSGDGSDQMVNNCLHQHSIMIDAISEYLDHENCIKMMETHKCLECNILGIVIYYIPQEISWLHSIDEV